MIVNQTHVKMVVHAMILSAVSVAHVRQVLLEFSVKSMWMTAPPHLATIMEHALIALAGSIASVQLVLLVHAAKATSTSVFQTPALPMEHKTACNSSTTTIATASQAIWAAFAN